MEFLLENIGGNKVVLDIKTNHYQETYDYPNETYSKFNEIEDVLSMYKEKLKEPPSPPPIKAVVLSDPLLYKVLLHLDPTLSLIDDKNIFIDKFSRH